MASPRHDLLLTHANPSGRLDYIVTLAGRLAGGDQRVTRRYVPDRLLLDATAFTSYLAAQPSPPLGIEALAVSVLADLNDVLIPRWLHVAVSTADGDHRAVIEDCQPRWNNTALLQCLERL